MGTVKTDSSHTGTNVVVYVRCGRHRQDGSRCRKTWFKGFGTTGDLILIGEGWTGDRWHGARYVARDYVTEEGFLAFDETRWEIPCTKRCGAHPTVKKATLQGAVREAARRGESAVWLADIAG